MEAPACNSRNGWSSSPLTSVCHGKLEDALVDRAPVIVPCYNGKSLQIHEELVMNGLSAISIQHPKGNCGEVADSMSNAQALREMTDSSRDLRENKSKSSKLSGTSHDSMKKHSATGLPVCLKEKMKRRNSFWNLHRPELSKLTWPQNYISSAMLQDFFHHHLRTHGTFCEPLHVETDRTHVLAEEIHEYALLRELVPPMVLPPDEKAMNIMEKSRSVQLNDEDLDPEIVVHKSRAEFCVTIGEYVRKSFLKRSVSQQSPKSGMLLAARFVSLPIQREHFLSKEEITTEKLVSSIISNPAGHLISAHNGENGYGKMMASTGENNGCVSVEEFGNSSSSHVTLRTNKIQNGGDFTTDSKEKL